MSTRSPGVNVSGASEDVLVRSGKMEAELRRGGEALKASEAGSSCTLE